MKLKLIVLAMVATLTLSCQEDKSYEDPGLEVNVNNISGTWYAAEVNGEPLADGTYVYLELERRDKRFSIYQNLDSFQSRLQQGDFALDTDPYIGTLIRGIYDFEQGYWSTRYVITELDKESMLWTAEGTSNKTLYRRCEEIPDSIKN